MLPAAAKQPLPLHASLVLLDKEKKESGCEEQPQTGRWTTKTGGSLLGEKNQDEGESRDGGDGECNEPGFTPRPGEAGPPEEASAVYPPSPRSLEPGKRRLNILAEIVATEKEYNRDLALLHNVSKFSLLLSSSSQPILIQLPLVSCTYSR